MGSTVVSDVLVTLTDPHVLIAADLREHVDATAQSRGPIDTRRRARERIRYDSVHPDLGMVGFEGRKEAPGEWCFGGILRVGCRLARSLFGGDTLLLQDLVRFIPRTARRGGLREAHAHGYGELRSYQDEKHEALPPERAATCFIAEFIQLGERLGRLRARVVGVVNDEAARGEAMVPQDEPPTGHQEVFPGHLAVSKHP
jgi:hypothetical protein